MAHLRTFLGIGVSARPGRPQASHNRQPREDARWQELALSREVSAPELFFPHQGETQAARAAKRVCGNCEVTNECLRYALAHDEQGVWGGTTESERRTILRKLRARRAARGGAA